MDATTVRIAVTPDASVALGRLRTLLEFSGENEADIFSVHVLAELERRIAKLKAGR